MPNEIKESTADKSASASLPDADSGPGEMGAETHQEGQGDTAQPESLLDAVKSRIGSKTDVVDKKAAVSDSPSDADTEKGEDAEKSVSENETDAATEVAEDGTEEEGGDEKEDVAAEDDAEAEKGPVPYERFSEITEKLRTTESAVQALKPKADNFEQIVRFCEQNNIGGKQFEETLQTMALMNTDPAEALKRLLPIVDELQGFTGNKLPDDLQRDVDEGTLSIARAREVAQLRAQTKFGSKKAEYDQKVAAERQQKEFEANVRQAAMTWENGKRGSDPDYKPGTDKWTLTRNNYLALVNEVDAEGRLANPIKTTQEMTALMERAYLDASKLLAKYAVRTKPPTRKRLSSNGSSTISADTRPETAASMGEAVNRYLSNRKII